jgi:plasmid stabilization system protein ParE
MILLSADAVEDIERLRSFLDQNNPDAARRALALIWTAIDRLQEYPDLGMPTGDAGIRQIVSGLVLPAISYVMPRCPRTEIS